MKLAICTDVYASLPFPEMLDKVKAQGILGVEMTAGGWGGCPHVPTQALLADPAKLTAFKAELVKRGMEIAALNCSGNPLCPGEMGEKHTKSTYDTVVLAGKLGVKTNDVQAPEEGGETGGENGQDMNMQLTGNGPAPTPQPAPPGQAAPPMPGAPMPGSPPMPGMGGAPPMQGLPGLPPQ